MIEDIFIKLQAHTDTHGTQAATSYYYYYSNTFTRLVNDLLLYYSKTFTCLVIDLFRGSILLTDHPRISQDLSQEQS